MATSTQIEANRRNAQRSTGPRTPEGKAVSRFNATKTGVTARSMVIPGEDAAELETLSAEYQDQFQPASALERFLVDALISADWQLRRLRRIEAQLWTHELADSPDTESSLGAVFTRSPQSFQLLQRRIDAAERSYYRALKELQRLPAEADFVPASDPWSPAPAKPAPELASFSRMPVEAQDSPCALDPQCSVGPPLPPAA